MSYDDGAVRRADGRGEHSVGGIGVRQQAELEAADLEAHIEGLVEIGLLAQQGDPTLSSPQGPGQDR